MKGFGCMHDSGCKNREWCGDVGLCAGAMDADGEKLRQLIGEDHGPRFISAGPKCLIEFDDAGASNDYPVKGVTVGDIRSWFGQYEHLRNVLSDIASGSQEEPREPDDADWRFRYLENIRVARLALDSTP